MNTGELITPASTAPVTIAQLRRQCFVLEDEPEHDADLEQFERQAREYLEEQLGLAFGTQTRLLTRRAWPYASCSLELLPAPLQSVSSIQYYDTDDVLQTLDPSVYGVYTHRRPGWIELLPGESWPTTADRADAVQITYQCGFVETPQPITGALLRLVLNQFEHRGDEADTGAWSDTLRILRTYRAYVL